jgi:hypothetical protein
MFVLIDKGRKWEMQAFSPTSLLYSHQLELWQVYLLMNKHAKIC